MTTWRILRSIDTSHQVQNSTQRDAEALWNMQYDARLLEEIIANRIPPTLRLYTWKYPAMTVGRFQNIERTVDLEFCQQHDIPIVRRITGGRGILHGTDLTISLVSPIASLLPQGYSAKGVDQIYAVISKVFLKAFEACGIEAQRGSESGKAQGQGNCFALHSPADILNSAGTDKMLGAALHRSSDYVLMQASVPRRGDETVLRSMFRGENPSRCLPADFDLERFEQIFVSQFTETFGISTWTPEPIDRNPSV